MSGFNHDVPSRAERIKRGLMAWCAFLLFVLGVWLLVEPAQAHGSEKVDNVVATIASPRAVFTRRVLPLTDGASE
jgi:hypothetical protein